jgi:hypothetical protein
VRYRASRYLSAGFRGAFEDAPNGGFEMKVLLKCNVSADRDYAVGETCDLDDALATLLIERGDAVAVDGETPSATVDPATEEAVQAFLDAKETAEKRADVAEGALVKAVEDITALQADLAKAKARADEAEAEVAELKKAAASPPPPPPPASKAAAKVAA